MGFRLFRKNFWVTAKGGRLSEGNENEGKLTFLYVFGYDNFFRKIGGIFLLAFEW